MKNPFRSSRKRRKNESQGSPFPGSAAYWEDRYAAGRDSGVGSYNQFAQFKAEVLNRFVCENRVHSVIEFGSGDGNQLRLTPYPEYLGFDVSDTAIRNCRSEFAKDPRKSFRPLSQYNGETADLALSLDVIYHLIEDEIFHAYMARLFGAARDYVVIYSSNGEPQGFEAVPHVRHRRFTDWIDANQAEWRLREYIPNRYPFAGDHRKGSFADFYIFDKSTL